MSELDQCRLLNESACNNEIEGLLDSPPDPVFDRLARFATRFFRMPTALVIVAEESRPWFRARYGIETPQTPQRLSLSAEAILEDRVVVVPDAALDERFAGGEPATGSARVGFYAGVPLKTPEGHVLGAFCIIDRKPHPEFDEQDRRDLEEFARIAMHELEMRAAQRTAEAARQAEAEARAAAERAEARYRAVVETAVDAMIVIDERGVMQSFNTAAERIFGYAAEEAIGRNVSILMAEPDRSRHEDYMARYRRTGERRMIGIGNTVSGRRKNGSVFPLELSVAEWSVGRERYFTGIMRDITDRRRTEEALRASEARFRSLIEHSPQLMWVNRPDGALDFFNAAWRSYTGHATEETTRWDTAHPEDHGPIRELRERAIAAGEPYEFETRLRRADGHYRWHVSRVNPMHENGTVTAWIGTALDVDDIRRAQEAAEEAARSKSRFLAAASHDLRQPVQSILLFAEALRPHLSEGGRNAFAQLQLGLDSLKGLLDSLLDISRLDAGAVTPQIEDFPVSDVIDLLKGSCAPLAERKGLAWHVASCRLAVRSDRVLLGRMLRNLIDNAIRYTDRGGVEVGCVVRDACLRLDVRDTGIGIPPDQQGRIFEEFHQVHNAERDRNQGLGLGLAIVRRLSVLLDHPIQVRSSPGEGSIFSIDVPLARSGPLSRPLPAGAGPARADGREGRFAVVVEDEAMVLMGLRAMLEEWGYDVLIAVSTEQAIERLEAVGRKPDIVLADYRLREGRAGTEAILRVRDLYGPEVPGIILTGEIGPEPQIDAALHGLAVLHKPVTPRLLGAALDRYVRAASPPDGTGASDG